MTLRSIPLSGYVFGAVFLVRLIVLGRLTDSPFLLPSQGDMHFYNDWALRILRGDLTDGQAFYGLPLYPWLLAGIYKIFGFSPFVPGFLQALLDGGTAVIIYKLCEHIFGRRSGGVPLVSADYPLQVSPFPQLSPGVAVGLIAAAGWAFFQPAQAYSAILMPSAWLVFVFWFVVWQIVKRREIPRFGAALLLGLLIGFTAMGIATVLFLVPLLVAAVFFKWRAHCPVEPTRPRAARWRAARVRGQALLAIFAGLIMGASPCWIHNYFIARDPVVLSAHSGVNFWIGNNPSANGYPRMPPGLHSGQAAMLQDSIATAEKAAGRPLRRAEVSAYWSAKANAYIRENPAKWLKLLGAKIANFWNAFQYDDLSIITNLRLQGVLLPGLRFGIVAALALAGMIFAIIQAPPSRWILAAILLHMASLLSVFVTERYRIAAVPGLLIFAAFGIFHFWESLRGGQRGRAAIYFSMLILATFAVSVRRGDPSLWALEPYNSGWQALQSRNFLLAKEKLELAYAYVPENAEINFALGNLNFERGDPNGAKPFYVATLKLDPTHEGAWNNLGVLALAEERWELAIKFFHGALQAGPNDPKTHYLLARAHLEMGHIDEARKRIDTAVKLKPDQPEFADLARVIAERR